MTTWPTKIIDENTVRCSITGCARCHGVGHQDLIFHRLQHSVLVAYDQGDGDDAYTILDATHWSMCPTTGEPILMANVPKEDTVSEQDQEREHMEDSRPEEPGTVGDQLEDVSEPEAQPEQPEEAGDDLTG